MGGKPGAPPVPVLDPGEKDAYDVLRLGGAIIAAKGSYGASDINQGKGERR